MSKIAGEGVSGVALSALKAQQARMRIIAENMANSASTANVPGGQPYRRQAAVFEVAKTEDGAVGVRMKAAAPDPSPFHKDFNPGHPAADAAGYVLTPNVDGLVEALDMKQAMRAYEANMNVLENQDAVEKSTLSLLRK